MSLADLAQLWEDHSTAITVGIVLAVIARAGFRARSNLRRFAELQADRRAVAASLGFRAPGTDPDRSPMDGALATLADGLEKFGRFPLFARYTRVRLQFEGERHGLKLTVFAHTPDAGTGPDPTTTGVFFASPEIDVPEFWLRPNLGKLSPEVDAALNFVGKGFARVFGPSDPEIQFPERPRFGELYSLTSTFTVRIRDAFNARALEFFEKHPGWTVEGMNGKLLVYRDDVEEPPDRIAGFVAEATSVAEVFRKTA